MLSFIVPVKSKRVSRDWPSFCKLFEGTLKSICKQTDEDFKVIVVCHEMPEINFTHKNIHFVQVEFEPPIREENESNNSINKRREIDKGKKLKIGTAYALENFNTDYVMTVDSDDFISNRIAAHVNQSAGDVPGWYVKHGYIHMDGKKFLISTRKFSYLCGSSVIVKPNYLKYFFEVDPILYFDHRLTVLNNEISLSILPFYAGIYSIANGENHLMTVSNVKKSNNHKGWLGMSGIKRIIHRISTYRFKFITKKIRNEFSFNI
ncbi:glycosyltransferase family A protein [Winogradskyella sp. A2]|uniref:glycosyltransferase family A protein n=1 Tax=Winogradskyella sp. A2 TaxID=3366944 RepID=UPI00398C630F